MKTILIDYKFFKLNKSICSGLISGLNKLSNHSFKLFSKNEIPSNLSEIFNCEDITISAAEVDLKADYIISAEQVNEIDSKNIFVNEKGKIKTFADAAYKLVYHNRTAKVKRTTNETDIELEIFLDGSGESNISTGIGFFDHMLEQISKHANLDLTIKVKGDLHVDEHHTVEDVGICLGEAILKALGDKKGIQRYGFLLPMDDAIAECAIDLGGRTYLNFNCKFKREKVGEFPTELVEEFFRGVAVSMKANVYLKAKGKNEHHKIEGMFKAFAKALNEALRIDSRNNNSIPSTKGML
ncbi:MAG: imidazoleglycerol-phosphate dehydratase HisB [Ignavibacteriae bacterium]|nr:imidazoleglycerol-phosphate dehydratase HisB [Ignavibacteriota bacterium]NOH00261.1 imidazoleglycerol-phosphate dehydratase HisB [Ignavibacteriota bacterium]